MKLVPRFQNPAGSLKVSYRNEDAVRNNQSNRNTAKGLWNGILSGDVVPSMNNIGRMVSSAFNGWFNQEQENPNLQTGAPTILPGRMDNVLLMEKEAPTMFKMLAENPQEMRELIREFRIGTGTTWSQVYKPFNGLARKIKTFLQSGDRNLLKELERWAVQNKNILVKPKDFSESSIVPKGYIKGSYPDKVADYTQRGLTRPKPMSDQQWGDPDFEDYGGYIDRITSLYKKGGKL